MRYLNIDSDLISLRGYLWRAEMKKEAEREKVAWHWWLS